MLGEIEPGVDPLRQQVERQREDVHVAGALPVAEERPLHARRAGEQRQFGGGHGRPAVVVRVDAQDRALRAGEVPQEPLDAVGVDVRRGHLDRRREVEDRRPLRRRAPGLEHRLADLERELRLGAGEALGRVLEGHLGPGQPLRLLARLAGGGHRKLDHLAPRQPEDHAPLQRRGRVVEVEDRPAGAASASQVRRISGSRAWVSTWIATALRHEALVDQPPGEVEFDLRGRGEADLDLREADGGEESEELELLLDAHRLRERLVAVAQIDAAPARRPRDGARGPAPVGEVDGRAGAVLRPGLLPLRGAAGHVALLHALVSEERRAAGMKKATECSSVALGLLRLRVVRCPGDPQAATAGVPGHSRSRVRRPMDESCGDSAPKRSCSRERAAVKIAAS